MDKLYRIKRTQIQMLRDRGYVVEQQELDLLDYDMYQFSCYVDWLVKMNATQKFIVTPRSSLDNIYTHRTKTVTDLVPVVRDGQYGRNVNTGEILYENVTIPHRLLVCYAERDKQQKQVSINTIKLFMAACENFGVNEAILIVNAGLSPDANKNLANGLEIPFTIFHDSIMMFNVTETIANRNMATFNAFHDPALLKIVNSPKYTLLTHEEEIKFLKESKVAKSQLPMLSHQDPIVKYYGWEIGSIVKLIRYDPSNTMCPYSVHRELICDIGDK